MILTVIVVGIFAFLILRQQTEKPNSIAELEQFAKLPEKPKPIAEFEHGAFIYLVAFSPADPSLVASAGSAGMDKTIKLWNRNNTSALEATLTGHTEAVTSIAFSSTGQFLASGSLDGTIILWDVSGKRSIKLLEHRVDGTLWDINAVSFSPDGKWLVSAGKNVKFWDITDLHNPMEAPPTLTHDDWIKVVDFSPDGKLLATGDPGGTVKIWDMQSEKVIKILQENSVLHRRPFVPIKFSPDNRLLATSTDYVKLWNVPDWHLHGALPSFSQGLAFSRDGKVLARAITRTKKEMKGEMELWSMENGAQIASLKGNTQYFTTVAFSADGTVLASGGHDGILRIWDVAPYLTPQQLDTSPKVKLIYFVPRDRQPRPNIRAKLDKLIKEVQQVYTNEMERHGFGKKTFDFEKDENGKVVVYRIDGEFTTGHYLEETSTKVIEEYRQFDDNLQNVWFFVVDISSERIGRTVLGKGGLRTREMKGVSHAYHAYAWIPASGVGFDVCIAAHELGHAFGLEHNFREYNSSGGSYIMSYDRVSPYRLSKGAAEWLDKSRFFNHNRTFFNKPSTIDQSDKTQLLFELKDADGLHQAQLAVPTTASDFIPTLESYSEEDVETKANNMASNPGTKWKLHSYQQLKGQETATVEFELTADLVKEVRLLVIDENGNIAEREFKLTEDSSKQPESP